MTVVLTGGASLNGIDVDGTPVTQISFAGGPLIEKDRIIQTAAANQHRPRFLHQADHPLPADARRHRLLGPAPAGRRVAIGHVRPQGGARLL